MIQIIAAEHPETGFLSFKCPFCNKIHNHGQGFGSRSSHCSKFDGEYELVREGKNE